MDLEARLEGGPFDGADDLMPDIVNVPGEVRAWVCGTCRDVHIDPEGPSDGERYLFVRLDDFGALYRWAEQNRDRGRAFVSEDELVPA